MDDNMDETWTDPVLIEMDEDEECNHAMCHTPSRYLWKDYRNELGKWLLTDELVARAPPGHRYSEWYVPNESFSRLNIFHCPTYGSCPHCLGSGPIGMFCQTCQSDQRYRMIMMGKRIRDIIDSEWLSLALQRPHLDAWCDREVMWTSPPVAYFDEDLRIRMTSVPYFDTRIWCNDTMSYHHKAVDLFCKLDTTIYQDDLWTGYVYPDRIRLSPHMKPYGEDREWQPIPDDWKVRKG
jgi:hypothetical protein